MKVHLRYSLFLCAFYSIASENDGNLKRKSSTSQKALYVAWGCNLLMRKGVNVQTGRQKHVCRIGCDVANTEFTWWLFRTSSQSSTPVLSSHHQLQMHLIHIFSFLGETFRRLFTLGWKPEYCVNVGAEHTLLTPSSSCQRFCGKSLFKSNRGRFFVCISMTNPSVTGAITQCHDMWIQRDFDWLSVRLLSIGPRWRRYQRYTWALMLLQLWPLHYPLELHLL